MAKLAGLPHEVIVRAREVLAEHENAERRVTDIFPPALIPYRRSYNISLRCRSRCSSVCVKWI